MGDGTAIDYESTKPNILDDKEFFYYFAFGSNLLKERLRLANPSAVYVCNGALKNYRLDFGGFGRSWRGSPATIEEAPGDAVYGVVWKLEREHSKTLDAQEGGYRRLMVDIAVVPDGDGDEFVDIFSRLDTKFLRCRTYQMTERYKNSARKSACYLPSPYYKRVITAGAEEHRLPAFYQMKLHAIRDNEYCGPIDVNLSIFKNVSAG